MRSERLHDAALHVCRESVFGDQGVMLSWETVLDLKGVLVGWMWKEGRRVSDFLGFCKMLCQLSVFESKINNA